MCADNKWDEQNKKKKKMRPYKSRFKGRAIEALTVLYHIQIAKMCLDEILDPKPVGFFLGCAQKSGIYLIHLGQNQVHTEPSKKRAPRAVFCLYYENPFFSDEPKD